ncbi:MAG: succinylglutamate desuccinylase/aspartoacylase family protein [archaeon]
MVTLTPWNVPTGLEYSGIDGKHKQIEIARCVIDSGVPGPLLVAASGAHAGSLELSAVELLGRLQEDFEKIERGTVVILPMLNEPGFYQATRGFELAGASLDDMNRAYPGNPNGNPAERLVNSVYEAVAEPLRAHRRAFPGEKRVLAEGHADESCHPYTIIDIALNGDRELEQACADYASALGFPWVREGPREAYVKDGLDKSLTGAIVNVEGIPALTLEFDETDHHRLSGNEWGRSAVLALATRLGIFSEKRFHEITGTALPEPGKEHKYVNVHFRDLVQTAAPAHEVFNVKLGTQVFKGQEIGQLCFPLTFERVPIIASETGLFLAKPTCLAYNPNPNEVAYRIAVPC